MKKIVFVPLTIALCICILPSVFCAGTPNLTYNIIPTSENTRQLASTMNRVCDLVPGLIGLENTKLQVNLAIVSQNELDEIYRHIDARHATPKAFYVRLTHTIYTTKRYAKPGVLAHELTHALLDEYFAQPVPPKIAELIANYVDETISALF
jgi:hypothetical protein